MMMVIRFSFRMECVKYETPVYHCHCIYLNRKMHDMSNKWICNFFSVWIFVVWCIDKWTEDIVCGQQISCLFGHPHCRKGENDEINREKARQRKRSVQNICASTYTHTHTPHMSSAYFMAYIYIFFSLCYCNKFGLTGNFLFSFLWHFWLFRFGLSTHLPWTKQQL